MLVFLAQHAGDAGQRPFKDDGIRAGRHRQFDVVVAEEKGPILEGEADLAGLQNAAVLVLQKRQKHLVIEIGIDGMPVDIETTGVDGAGSVLQHVHPPAVGGIGDAHVIGHHIEDQAHTALAQGVAEGVEVRFAAQFGIEPAMIADVVAVAAAGPRLQHRRSIAICDP